MCPYFYDVGVITDLKECMLDTADAQADLSLSCLRMAVDVVVVFGACVFLFHTAQF